MKKKLKDIRRRREGAMRGMLLGAFLGLGAPLGSLALRLWVGDGFSYHAAASEFSANRFFYLYMMVSTPFVFAVFGIYLGFLGDLLAGQNEILSKVNKVLERQSMIDEVTGLANRRFLEFEIEREIARARRSKRPLAGLMMDIDDFKRVNDHYGHPAGDLVLAHVASVLRRSLRKGDIAGRYGGDEFLVILPEAPQEAARLVGLRVQRNIRDSKIENAHHLDATVSIGIIAFPDAETLTKKIFIEKVDSALLKAKQTGKDRIVFDSV